MKVVEHIVHNFEYVAYFTGKWKHGVFGAFAACQWTAGFKEIHAMTSM